MSNVTDWQEISSSTLSTIRVLWSWLRRGNKLHLPSSSRGVTLPDDPTPMPSPKSFCFIDSAGNSVCVVNTRKCCSLKCLLLIFSFMSVIYVNYFYPSTFAADPQSSFYDSQDLTKCSQKSGKRKADDSVDDIDWNDVFGSFKKAPNQGKGTIEYLLSEPITDATVLCYAKLYLLLICF